MQVGESPKDIPDYEVDSFAMYSNDANIDDMYDVYYEEQLHFTEEDLK